MDSKRFMSSSGHPIVWTRNSSGCNNIVVMNDEQIAVSTLPRAKRKLAGEQLAAGQSIDDVLGPDGTRIRFQAVSAGTAVEVVYDQDGRRLTTCRFPTASKQAQADILVEARNRMKGETQVVEKKTNRLWHATKPFNLLVILAVLSIGAQNYFTADIFNGEANGERLEKWGENADAKDIQLTRAKQGAFVETVSSNPAIQKVLVFGIIILGVFGTILNVLGYAATMTLLLGTTGLTLLWTLARLGNPPRTLSVIACQRG
jgi:hypothetical protein